MYILREARESLSGDSCGKGNKKEALVGASFVMYILLPYLEDIIFFASMLSVAWGTARRRALSISLPVTRQIP